jgi:hypothetical protein
MLTPDPSAFPHLQGGLTNSDNEFLFDYVVGILITV